MKKFLIFVAALLISAASLAQDSTAVKLIVGDREFLIPRLSNVGSGGGASSLVELTDVNTAAATNRFVLVANGTFYEGRALTEADISDLQTYLTAEVDGSTSNEIQTIDVSQLVGTNLELSLLHDAEATKVIDLSPLQDGTGTDDQTAAEVSVAAITGLTATDAQAAFAEHQADIDALSLSGDGLGPDGDKGDAIVGGTGTTLTIDNDAITSAKIANSTIDILDTDSGIQNSLGLADTALQSEVDGSTSNELQDLTIATNILSISNDPTPGATIDLSPYLDNTNLSNEQVQDIVGAMVSGNTETLISVDYQDTDGTIDFNVSSNLALYSTANVITFDNTTASTNKDTGGVIMQGGLGVEGAINAGGDITAFSSSDERLKKNIRPISNPIAKLKQLSGNYYRWNGIAQAALGKRGKDVGVIAQEVDKVLPEAVRTGTHGFEQVNYDKIVPLLIEAIKAQQEQIDELEKKLKKVKRAL